MKLCAVVVMSLAVLIVPARAQTPVTTSVGFGVHADAASLNFTGPLKDVYAAGWGGGLHLDVKLAMFGTRFSLDFIHFAPDNDKLKSATAAAAGAGFPTTLSVDGGAVNIYSLNANGKLDIVPLPVVKPYVTGGLGLVKVAVSDVTVSAAGIPDQIVSGDSGDIHATANLGAGVTLDVGLALWLEAKYTWIFASGGTSTYIPITLGITF